MKEYQYEIRAHHGMCICFFKGVGYSDKFSSHMVESIHKLNENPLVRISDKVDIICEKCPNNIQGICKTEKKVAEYDKQVLLQCSLTVGTILPFTDFRSKVMANIISMGKREKICGNCQWNKICF